MPTLASNSRTRLLAFGRRQFRMAPQRKRNVFLHRQRVVKCRVLEHETHGFPNFVHGFERRVCNVPPVDANRPRIRLLQPDDQFQQHTFSGSTAPQHHKRFSIAERQIHSIEDFLRAERFMQDFQDHSGHEITSVCMLFAPLTKWSVMRAVVSSCVIMERTPGSFSPK